MRMVDSLQCIAPQAASCKQYRSHVSIIDRLLVSTYYQWPSSYQIFLNNRHSQTFPLYNVKNWTVLEETGALVTSRTKCLQRKSRSMTVVTHIKLVCAVVSVNIAFQWSHRLSRRQSTFTTLLAQCLTSGAQERLSKEIHLLSTSLEDSDDSRRKALVGLPPGP